MDGLGRAIGAGVPIQFNGETIILDGITIADLGLIEQYLLSQRPNPMDLARKQSVEFIKEAAAMAPGLMVRRERLATLQAIDKPKPEETAEMRSLLESVTRDDEVRKEMLSMAEKVMADGRTEALKRNKVPAKEVGEWLDTVDGLIYTFWLKLNQRYPGKYPIDVVSQIIQSAHEADRDRMRKLRDQASGFDELGNSTGPTSQAMAVGPIGE